MSADADFEPRSTYFACRRCGALVVGDDRERHRSWHRSTTPTRTGPTDDQEPR